MEGVGCFEGKSIGEKAGVQGEEGFTLAELQGSQFLVRNDMYIFTFWGR